MNRDFKGVWIPAHIWLNEELSIIEKVLLVEIDSLDNDPEKGCFASNEYLAGFVKKDEGTVANIITGLRKRNYLTTCFWDGRVRGLRLVKNESSLHENMKAAFIDSGKQPSRKRESSLHENVNILIQDINTDTNNSISNEIEGAHEIGEPPIPITGYQVTVIEPVIEKPKPEKFIPPSKEEIQSDFSRKLSEIPNLSGPEYWAEWEARKFADHYQQTNWKTGKGKMKDWRLAVSGWITRSMERRTYLRPCPTDPNYNDQNQNGYGKEKQSIGTPNRAELAFARALARSNRESDQPGYEDSAWKQPR